MADGEYEVLSPEPARRTEGLEPAAAPDQLDGSKVAFVWDYLFQGPELFAALATELGRRYPSMTFVGFAEFGDIHGPDEMAVITELPDRMRQYRIDAAIVGIGA
jgi:hypothetical protein